MAHKWRYSEEFDTEICDWIADGKTLRAYCRQENKPSHQIVYQWLNEWPEFADRFARAREVGHDAIADEILGIVDVHPPSTANGGTDAGYVSWQKNQAWVRFQLLAKWNPKKYGESKQLELSGPNGGPIQTQATVVTGEGLDDEGREALIEALERALMASTGEDRPYVDEDEDDDSNAD
jgi:hypothetical protein